MQASLVQICILGISLVRPQYDVDNINIQIIQAGIFDNRQCWNGYTGLFIQCIIDSLNKLNQQTNWLAVYFWLVAVQSVIIFNKIICDTWSKWSNQSKIQIILLEIIVFGLYGSVLSINYTVLTSIAIQVGMLSIWKYIDTRENKWMAYEIVLEILSSGLRPQQIWLAIPYKTLFIIWIIQEYREKDGFKQRLITQIFVMSIQIILVTVDSVIISSISGYKQFVEFNTVRQQISDYTLKDVDRHSLIYYIQQWLYIDNSNVNNKSIGELLKHVNKDKNLIDHLGSFVLAIMLQAATILTLLIQLVSGIINSSDHKLKIVQTISLIGQIVICMYFTYIGRYAVGLQRVVQSTMYMCLPYIIIQHTSQKECRKCLVYTAILQMIIAFSIINVTDQNGNKLWKYTGTPFNSIDRSDEELTGQDNIYILNSDVWYHTLLDSMIQTGIIRQRDFRTIYSHGSTYTGTPQYEKYIEDTFHDNLMMQLINRDNTYYASENKPEIIVNYYKDILKMNVGCEIVDTVVIGNEELNCWKFSIMQ